MQLKDATVLVVDDERHYREIMTGWFERGRQPGSRGGKRGRGAGASPKERSPRDCYRHSHARHGRHRAGQAGKSDGEYHTGSRFDQWIFRPGSARCL